MNNQTINTIIGLYSDKKVKNKTFAKWLARVLDTTTPWSENDIIYFRKAVGHCGIKDVELRRILVDKFNETVSKIGGYDITPDQSNKGLDYIKSVAMRRDGTPSQSKDNCFGAREISIMNDFSKFTFAGLYEQVNGIGEVMGYLPIYETFGTDGNSFEYVGAAKGIMQVVA